MQTEITIYDNSVHQVVRTEAALEVLKDDCAFSEGPVWNREGFYLFSDIPDNVIYRVEPGSKAAVYLQPSGHTNGRQGLSGQPGSNGLAYDAQGRLLVCQHGNGAVARYDGRSLEPLITAYGGRAFNSPNDIVVHPNGRIFFSDPPYGLEGARLQPERFQPLAGMYCWEEGRVTLLTDRYQYPNGVCLSPDGKSLYTCSAKPFEAFVLEFDTHTLQPRRQVIAASSDGIKCDRRGNLFLCTKEGLLVASPEGKKLALIGLPAIPANCCWGGPDGNDMLVTARQYIFLMRQFQRP